VDKSERCAQRSWERRVSVHATSTERERERESDVLVAGRDGTGAKGVEEEMECKEPGDR
jgi:hypothetical protein